MRLPNLSIPRPLAMILCLAPLIPEALMPGRGGIVLMVVVPLILLLSGDARQAILRWYPESASREVMIGVAIGIGFAILSIGVIDPLLSHLLHEQTDLSAFASIRGHLANAIALTAIGWVLGGFMEELTSRAFIIGWGSRIFGEKATIPLLLVSTIAFGVTHLYQGRVGAISAGISGLVFGLVYLWRRKTLIAPIMLHGTFDTIGIAAIYLGINLA